MRDATPIALQPRALACCIAAALAPAVYAGPEGAQIVVGAGSVTQADGATTLITQSSDRLAIDWQSFDIGVDERVRFEQPSAQAAALNRILDQNPSIILGNIEANGRVYLINPNGLVFGATARIDVGALIASSLDLTTDNFAAGRNELEAGAAGAGLVLNRGIITAATGGSVTLLGGSVANEGLIVADLGQVTLGAGDRARLDFDGDGLLYFEVDEATVANPAATAAAVSNTGTIQADGGQVLLTARAAQNVFSEVVNNGGMIRAARIDDSGGVVRLVGSGGAVVTTGSIVATGAAASDAGGRVEVLGDRVGILDNASIDVSGSSGGTILVGGNRRGSGDVTSTLTLVGSDVTLAADAGTNGDGGDIVVWADEGTWFRGAASARGGELGGDGGFVEISGKESLVFSGTVDARAPHGALGTLLFDPSTITIFNGAGGTDDGDLPDLSNNGGNDTTAFTISEQALEALAAGADIVLEATGDITMQNLADNLLGLAVDSPGGSLNIEADVDGNGTGSFTMDASDTIRTESGNVTISGAGLAIGSIDVTGAIGTATNGSIALFSSGGAAIAGNLTADTGIAITVDTDDNGTATLSLAGTLTATTRNLTGTGNDILEANPTTADSFVGDVNAGGTLNGVAFQGFSTLSGRGGNDTFTLSAAFTSALGGVGNDVFALNSGAALTTVDGGADVDTVTVATGASVGTLTGGAGGADNDTLVRTAGANAWAVTALDAGTLNGNAFSEFENLTGGAGPDAFSFDAPVTGAIVGAAGNDTFTVNNVTLGSIDGGADADTVTLVGSGASVGTLTGGAGGTDNDTLTSCACTSTWLVSGLDSGMVNANAFSEFENLTGGSGVDAFTLTAAVTGTINGGAGDDTFAVNGVNVGSLDGGADSDRVTLGPGATAGTLTGGAGGADNDTLEAVANPNAWSVTATDAGTLNGVAFSEFENLTGGSGADTFALTAAITGTVAGGSGNDTLASGDGTNAWTVTALDVGTLNATAFSQIENLSGGAGADGFAFTAPVSGAVTGGAGNDTFAINGVNLTSLDGGADSDTVMLTPGSAVTTLSGGAGGIDADTLAMTTGTNAWTVTGFDVGVLNANFFTEFEALTGGDGADTFAFIGNLTGTAAGSAGDDTFNVLTGSVGAVNGGANTDTLSYAGSGIARALTVASLSAHGIENVVGSSSGGDVLQGTSANDVFTTSGFDAGTVNGALTYSAFESLEGLAGVDTFSLQHTVSGTVDGGDDADTFSVGAGAVAATILGGAGADTLSQSSGNATFTLTGSNTGTLNAVAFSAVENLTGSPGNDFFVFNGALTGTASGVGGSDTFAINDGGSAGAIDGGDGTDTQTYAGLTGPVIVTLGALSSIESLVGSSDGADTLVGTAAADTFATTAANAGTVDGIAYASFENLQGAGGADRFTLSHAPAGTVDGGTADDTFTLLAAFSGQVIGGAGADRFEVGANATGELLGGDGDDVYAIADGVTVGGFLDGATGRDVLDLSASRSARSVSLTAMGAVDGFNGNDASIATFRNIDAIVADAAIPSSLRGREADATWSIGVAGGNVYTSGGVDLAFAGFTNLAGGTAADHFRLGSANVAGGLAVNGGAGSDILETVGDLTVGGTLAIAGVEMIANRSAAVLAANTLTLDGATGGVGTAAAPLLVEVATLEVLRSDGGLFLVDRTGSLRVVNAQLGTGDVRIVVDQGDLVIGLIDAGGTGAASAPPAAGNGGHVELVATQGSILDDGAAVNVRARTATLRALSNIGGANDPITIAVPSNEKITLAVFNATIDNLGLATVDDTLVGGVLRDLAANATAAVVGAGAASSVLDVSAIDWIGLDPNVTLVDCTDPCVLLPMDQRVDDGFALLREATKVLLLRDGERLALIPVVDPRAQR